MAHFYPGQDLSKPGYLKRCMLLNHEVFWFLVRNHNCNFYADGIGHSFHGFLVLAMDGSNVLSPNTQENIENYETSSRKGNKPRAALGLFFVVRLRAIDFLDERSRMEGTVSVEMSHDAQTSLLGLRYLK